MARCGNLVGARFNTPTLRMELTSFYELMFNAVAQAKFVHGATSFSLASALSVVVSGRGPRCVSRFPRCCREVARQ